MRLSYGTVTKYYNRFIIKITYIYSIDNSTFYMSCYDDNPNLDFDQEGGS